MWVGTCFRDRDLRHTMATGSVLLSICWTCFSEFYTFCSSSGLTWYRPQILMCVSSLQILKGAYDMYVKGGEKGDIRDDDDWLRLLARSSQFERGALACFNYMLYWCNIAFLLHLSTPTTLTVWLSHQCYLKWQIHIWTFQSSPHDDASSTRWDHRNCTLTADLFATVQFITRKSNDHSRWCFVNNW